MCMIMKKRKIQPSYTIIWLIIPKKNFTIESINNASDESKNLQIVIKENMPNLFPSLEVKIDFKSN